MDNKTYSKSLCRTMYNVAKNKPSIYPEELNLKIAFLVIKQGVAKFEKIHKHRQNMRKSDSAYIRVT